MVGLSGDGVGEGKTEGVRAEEDVGVGEEQIIGAMEGDRVPGGKGHGVGFAKPAGG